MRSQMLAMATPRSIELDQDLFRRVQNQLFKAFADYDFHRFIVLLGNGR